MPLPAPHQKSHNKSAKINRLIFAPCREFNAVGFVLQFWLFSGWLDNRFKVLVYWILLSKVLDFLFFYCKYRCV